MRVLTNLTPAGVEYCGNRVWTNKSSASNLHEVHNDRSEQNARTERQLASAHLALAYPFLLQGFNVAYIVVAVADNRSPIKLTAKGAPVWLRVMHEICAACIFVLFLALLDKFAATHCCPF
jgi:hypothetical protein